MFAHEEQKTEPLPAPPLLDRGPGPVLPRPDLRILPQKEEAAAGNPSTLPAGEQVNQLKSPEEQQAEDEIAGLEAVLVAATHPNNSEKVGVLLEYRGKIPLWRVKFPQNARVRYAQHLIDEFTDGVFQDCEDAIGPIADELDALDPASAAGKLDQLRARPELKTWRANPLIGDRSPNVGPWRRHALLRFIDETFARKAKEIEKAANPAPVDPDTQPIDVIDEDSERAMLSASVHEEKSKVRLLFNALKVPIGWLTNQAGNLGGNVAAKVAATPDQGGALGNFGGNVLEEAVVSMLKRRWHDKKIGRLDALLEAAEHVENEKDLVLINYYIEELGADAEGTRDLVEEILVAQGGRKKRTEVAAPQGGELDRLGSRVEKVGGGSDEALGKGEDAATVAGTAMDGFGKLIDNLGALGLAAKTLAAGGSLLRYADATLQLRRMRQQDRARVDQDLGR